jgi:hypothetical protein
MTELLNKRTERTTKARRGKLPPEKSEFSKDKHCDATPCDAGCTVDPYRESYIGGTYSRGVAVARSDTWRNIPITLIWPCAGHLSVIDSMTMSAP